MLPYSEQLSKQFKRTFLRSKRRAVRFGIVGVNIVIVLSVAVLIVANRDAEVSTQAPVLNLVAESAEISPLDSLSSADIAVNIALMTGLPQTTAVLNHADSASTQVDIVPSGSQAIAKPQILRTNLKSKNDIQHYTVGEGDSLDGVAEKFGVSSNSIRWSNDLASGAALEVGSILVIPPVEGIVYTVINGDTPDSLANKYRSDTGRIVAFNDAEINGLIEGDQIVIPDGEIVPPRPVYSASAPANFRAAFGPGNGYDFGWCTWHAANRRIESGRPLPRNLGNAVTWSARARAAGMTVADTPVAGAVVWHDQRNSGYVAGGLGHVAYVESVNPDGSAVVSDMNSRGTANPDGSGGPAGGWARVSYRIVPPSEFYKYDFIY